MRWNAKIKIPESILRVGEIHRRIVFAFLPHKTATNEWIWLEKIIKCERYLTDVFTGGRSWQHWDWESYRQ